MAQVRKPLPKQSMKDRLGARWESFTFWWEQQSSTKHLLIGGGVGLILIALIAGGGFWYLQQSNPKNEETPAAFKALQAKIGKHYLLPTDETPALATVTDTSKLSSQLFKNAQNGDKVLIYQRNSVAIVYRPSADRIVAVGPVEIDTPKGGTEPKVNK